MKCQALFSEKYKKKKSTAAVVISTLKVTTGSRRVTIGNKNEGETAYNLASMCTSKSNLSNISVLLTSTADRFS